ncbi:hypothetical protein L1887_54072 [Cichorium endivia]|nr:hypothetical protein L1887_54072 [Cichorium endivia]
MPAHGEGMVRLRISRQAADARPDPPAEAAPVEFRSSPTSTPSCRAHPEDITAAHRAWRDHPPTALWTATPYLTLTLAQMKLSCSLRAWCPYHEATGGRPTKTDMVICSTLHMVVQRLRFILGPAGPIAVQFGAMRSSSPGARAASELQASSTQLCLADPSWRRCGNRKLSIPHDCRCPSQAMNRFTPMAGNLQVDSLSLFRPLVTAKKLGPNCVSCRIVCWLRRMTSPSRFERRYKGR